MILRYFLVFTFFFSLFSFIQFSSPNFISSDDGFYHVKHSWLYLKEGLKAAYDFPYLQFSILKDKPVDIYFLYHLFLAPFTLFFNGENYQSLINGSKLFHSFLAALFFLVFYFILKSLSKDKPQDWRSEIYNFFWLLFLLSVSFYFVFRLLMPRPHILSLIFLLLGFYFIVKRKLFLLLVLSALYVLSYSVSFLILILTLIYFISNYFYFKGRNLLFSFQPFFNSFLGVLIGILIHPNGFNYLYNAYFVPLSVVFYRFFGIGKLFLGGEMYSTDFEFQTIFLLFPLLCFSISYLLFLFENEKDWRKKISSEKFFLFCIVILFFFTSLLIIRAAEYFIPFTVLFLALIYKENILPFFKEEFRLKIKEFVERKIDHSFNKKIEFFKMILQGLLRDLILEETKIKKFLKSTFLAFIILVFVINISGAIVLISKNQDYKIYKEISQLIAKNSKKGDVVFNTNWGDFPKLFFYNHHNYYIIGMDPTFMYLKDREKYFRWLNISLNGFSCPKEKCKENEKEDVYKVLKEEFKAKYIFLDDKFSNKLLNVLDSDERFEKVHEAFVRDFKIIVYKIKD
jgi:hypothetical protein